MAAVNDSLDDLSTVLDYFEQRTDNIIEQLKQLLHSNREIRQELALENAANDVENLDLDKTNAWKVFEEIKIMDNRAIQHT